MVNKKEKKSSEKEQISEEDKIYNDLRKWEREQNSSDDDIQNPVTKPSYPTLSVPKPSFGYKVSSVRKSPRQLYVLYLTNQFLFRGINFRGDKIVSRGYEINGGDEEGRKLCEDLMVKSGGIRFIKQLSVNADIGGITFIEKLPNEARTKIKKLKHLSPINIGFKRNQTTGMIAVDKAGEPKGFVQYFIDEDGKTFEEEIKEKARISSFKFNSLGDEFDGVSILQPVYDTAVRLMNMEYAAAVAAVRTANPLLIGKCNTKSPKLIKQWGHVLGKISGKDQVFLPDGMELDMLSPGQQNFSDYSPYFLNAAVAATGVPKSILLGESQSGSRAETIELINSLNESLRINQLAVDDFFNEIFKEYGELAGFEPPTFHLGDITEDIAMSTELIIQLVDKGIISPEMARELIPLKGLSKGTKAVEENIKKSDSKTYFPSEGSSPQGKQEGIKQKQKISPHSIVNPITTK